MSESLEYKTDDHCVSGTRTGDQWDLTCDCGWNTTAPNGEEDDAIATHLDDVHPT